jgi:hypothetical protein
MQGRALAKQLLAIAICLATTTAALAQIVLPDDLTLTPPTAAAQLTLPGDLALTPPPGDSPADIAAFAGARGEGAWDGVVKGRGGTPLSEREITN